MRVFLEELNKRGEIITVEEEVDPHNFELASLIRHSEDGPNKAVFFRRVKGYDIPVVGNLYGSLWRCAIGCGLTPTPEEVERYRRDPHGGPGGLGGGSTPGFYTFSRSDEERAATVLLRKALLQGDEMAAKGRYPFRLVKEGPCKEVIITKDIDLLAMLPIPWHCEGDVGPFINPGGLVQRDPDSGILNVGVRRHQVTHEGYGKDRMGVLIVEVTDGAKILRKYQERNQPCPVALCIGLDPVTEIVANYSSPHFTYPHPSYSEFDIVGAMRGEPLEMVKCETVDLEVPATTEIVVEGFIPPHDRIKEGPMAEFTDHYAMRGPLPFIQVTAITHRKNPIFQTLMSGKSEEHIVLGVVTGLGREQMNLARVKTAFPSVQDVALYAGSHSIFHLVVSLKQRYPGEDKMLLHYLMATTLYKYVTIVDEDVEPHNSEQVEWARAMRAGRSPDDFQVFPGMHTAELDPEKDERSMVTRLGVLATLPYGEKYIRTGPPKEMLDRTRPLFEKVVSQAPPAKLL